MMKSIVVTFKRRKRSKMLISMLRLKLKMISMVKLKFKVKVVK